MLAQFRYALQLGIRPELLILNCDEFFLDGENKLGQLRSGGVPALLATMPQRDQWRLMIGSLKACDINQTWLSLQALLHPAPKINGEITQIDGVIYLLGNGYQVRYKQIVARQAGGYDVKSHVVEQNVADLLEASKAGLVSDSGAIAQFRGLLALAKAEGTKVHVVLTPIHTVLEERLVSRNPKFRQERAEFGKTIEKLCGECGSVFHDFTDVSSFHETRKSFGMEPT